jgi:drug/metabolite transporter (DMT)-like permease
MERRPSPLLVWAALWTVYIVWGSTYLGIRVMDETIPPFLGATVRSLGAGLLLGGFLVARRGPRALRVTRRELASLAVVGTLLIVAANGVLIYAETSVPAGIAAVVVASVPLWIVVLRLVARDRPAVATVGATLVGFLGVVLLVFSHDRPAGATVGGLLLVLGASFAWALGSFLSSRLPMPADAFVATAWETLLAAPVLFVLSVPELGGFNPAEVSLRSATGLAYLITFGSIVGLTAYVWLLQNAPISKVSTYAYVNPIVAIGAGALLLGEKITGGIVIGGAVIVLAVAAVVTFEGRSARANGARARSAARATVRPQPSARA